MYLLGVILENKGLANFLKNFSKMKQGDTQFVSFLKHGDRHTIFV